MSRNAKGNRRPPKPEGMASNPRRKGKADPNGQAPLPSLTEITRLRPHPSEIDAHFELIGKMSDREAALSYGALLENIIEDALIANMLVLNERRFEELFRDPGAPLQSWSAKITLAHALGLIGDEMRRQMDQVRKIRNTFAHAMRPLDFANPTLTAEGMKLDARRMLRPELTPAEFSDDPRGRYCDACHMMINHLMDYMQSVLAAVRSGERPRPSTYRSRFA